MKNDRRRDGGYTKRGDAYYARVRLGKGKRIEPRMSGVADDETAAVRAKQIAEVADALVGARRAYDIREFARSIGACTTDKQARIFVKAARLLCEQSLAPDYAAMTFEKFAARWTSGQLHIDHPDHVAKKQHAGDINILKNRINPLVGPIPLVSFTLEDADRVMRELPAPPALSRAYRRHVAQVLHRVLALAVYPAKIIKANPLPKGWLPRLDTPKERSFLYPKEEASFQANRALDVRKRMLAGFLMREGPRKSRIVLLPWTAFNLELEGDRGTISLPKVKKSPASTWVLRPDVVRALRIWKRIAGGEGPFVGIDVQHLGEWLREALIASGVNRPQLFENDTDRLHFRAHDTRSTFVTYALAEDRSERWIMKRTGHTSSQMINRYSAAADNAKELDLGPLLPLDEVLPELSEVAVVPSANELKRAGGERGRAARAAKRLGETARVGEDWVKGAGMQRDGGE